MKTLAIIAVAAVLVSNVIRILYKISIENDEKVIWDIK
jgi:hypothetical protein